MTQVTLFCVATKNLPSEELVLVTTELFTSKDQARHYIDNNAHDLPTKVGIFPMKLGPNDLNIQVMPDPKYVKLYVVSDRNSEAVEIPKGWFLTHWSRSALQDFEVYQKHHSKMNVYDIDCVGKYGSIPDNWKKVWPIYTREPSTIKPRLKDGDWCYMVNPDTHMLTPAICKQTVVESDTSTTDILISIADGPVTETRTVPLSQLTRVTPIEEVPNQYPLSLIEYGPSNSGDDSA